MSTLPVPWLRPGSAAPFPDPRTALRKPDGLLAIGGDLGSARLLKAYANGIFPWYGESEPILWWSPDPRCVFATTSGHVGHSLCKLLRRVPWSITIDQSFRQVMQACAAPRSGQREGTWIMPEMVEAYVRLHHKGHAHSLEVWQEGELIGGLYGVAVGRLFCGESMFGTVSGASKAALTAMRQLLARWGFPLLDAQVGNPHLYRMGAVDLPRETFLARVQALCEHPAEPGAFRLDAPMAVADFAIGNWSIVAPAVESLDDPALPGPR